MAKIVIQHDKNGQHMIEFEVNGKPVHVVVDDNHVQVISPCMFVDIDSHSVNSFTAILEGSQFDTVSAFNKRFDSL